MVQPTCQEVPFCNRNLHLQKHFTQEANNSDADFFYSLDATSIQVDDSKGSIKARLNLACSDSTDEISPELDLTLHFY